MLRRFIKDAAFVCIPVAVVAACSSPIVMAEDSTPSAGFGGDAGNDGRVDSGPTLTEYCPSSKCPPGWTTCPNSRFPCDVNIWTDVSNCGGCGNACPSGRPLFEIFACVEGACTMTCGNEALNCDGLLDNGCENPVRDNNDCGICGRKCTDPAKPCLKQPSDAYDCGCPAGETLCGRQCTNTTFDDKNCGECRNPCDPTAGGAPVYDNTYYGCIDSKCDRLKCKPGYGDCDGILSTGCETYLATDTDCGGCGNACSGDQICQIDLNYQPTCMCPEGLTFCPVGTCSKPPCRGACVDLTADDKNCGACGVSCGPSVALFGANKVCDYGACTMTCYDGRADCNNSEADGCEVNTKSDPRNCGGCGHVCDAVAGQACVGGQCVLEPCEEGVGGVTQ